jgi:hypothetical protein
MRQTCLPESCTSRREKNQTIKRLASILLFSGCVAADSEAPAIKERSRVKRYVIDASTVIEDLHRMPLGLKLANLVSGVSSLAPEFLNVETLSVVQCAVLRYRFEEHRTLVLEDLPQSADGSHFAHYFQLFRTFDISNSNLFQTRFQHNKLT